MVAAGSADVHMRPTSMVAIGVVAGATLVAGRGAGSLDATKVASAVRYAFEVKLEDANGGVNWSSTDLDL